MPHRSDDAVPRRAFLEQLTARSLAAGAATAVPLSTLIAEEVGAAGPTSAAWDMSWVDRLANAKYKAVFDSPAVASGLALGHVDLYLKGFNEVYGTNERDFATVLVVRHDGIPLILGDSFWERHQLGQKLRIMDPATRAAATQNPWTRGATTPAEVVTFEDLMARGVIVLACSTALLSAASILAQQAGQASDALQAEAKAAVVPGVTLMPTGIFAIMRAQQAGCLYIRST